ncbi:hypothetical protein ASPZODRAFT_1913899 [Penicilliopsis zonata CBS 506.65]|uniref:UspA domain-containing protein n=1 Tax=Penicilliopsis zonata CBS 506.65 TaxID=1073090 RepID=A0A1L9SIZ2_9EURO|nr:hypothetical protein ASPZODRAFT_1913899 [Penicilliopsis zonata CBS 506.65]OJJ47200.1 hypothetical protein ASPZODRAFT_1913899 [Penicilliopsis zonata CBS 506.65]
MGMSRRRRVRLSQEDALEEDRREVVDLLEGRLAAPSATVSSRPTPPAGSSKRATSPIVTPVRSLLEACPSTPLPGRDGSVAGINSRAGTILSTGRDPPVRSLIEPTPAVGVLCPPIQNDTRRKKKKEKKEKERKNKTLLFVGVADHPPRRSSDNTDYRLSREKKPFARPDLHPQFTDTTTAGPMPPSVPSRDALPARPSKSSMVSRMAGLDLKGPFARGRDAGGRTSTSTRGMSADPSTTARIGRSASRNRWLSSPFNLASRSGKLVTDQGKLIDMDNAYRHFADDELAKSAGSLAALSKANRASEDDGGVPAAVAAAANATTRGDERLAKDLFDSENNPIDSSDEDEVEESTSSDEEGGRSPTRGRKKSTAEPSAATQGNDHNTEDNTQVKEEEADEHDDDADSVETARPDQIAEQEHQTVAGRYHVKSLLPPEPHKPVKKSDVHPRTSFDNTASAIGTPFGSDDEAELSDIARAQKLSIQMSAIDHSIPHRAIRTIIRGDFASIKNEAEEGRRRQRKYLVATDLSEESVYALEWTIGGILRDGDTMFAVFAVSDENASGSRDVDPATPTRLIHDTTAVVGSQTEETTNKSQAEAATPLTRALFARLGSGTDSRSSSVDTKIMSKAELERSHAVESISQTCVRLLRKTTLQIRVAVEVIHCKNPKNMITEAIDGLEPTLVIVGARGRSAFKG